MSFSSWLAWTVSPSHARRGKRRNMATTASKSCRAYPPRLEALEDRCLLNGGALDPTFGNGAGYVATAPSYGPGPCPVLLQPSGNIVVAGTTHPPSGSTTQSAFGVVTYNADGSLDTAFGSGGSVVQPFAGISTGFENVEAAALEPMGGTGDSNVLLAGWVSAQGAMALMRLNPNGSLDTSFNGTGQVITPFPTSSSVEMARAVAVTSSGQILAVGQDGSDSVLLARYNPNGTLDTSFGGGGTATTVFTSTATNFRVDVRAMAQQPDGKFVVSANESWFVSGTGTIGRGMVLRYNANGSLDTTFGTDGIATVVIPFGSTPGNKYTGLAVDPNTGNIVVAGFVVGSQSTEWAVVRYTPSGSLDTSFGTGTGYVIIADPQSTYQDESAIAVAIDSDGKPIIVGESTSGSAQVARLNVDGSLDTSFGNGGLVTTGIGAVSDFDGVAIQPDGKIVAAGIRADFLVARYLASAPSFAVTGPSGVTVGTAGSFTLTALHADGTFDAGYSGTVKITSSDPKALLPGNITISGGSGTFSVTLKTSGPQSITATDVNNPIMTGVDIGVAVSPGVARQVVFTQTPSGGIAGGTLGSVRAVIEDAYGNVETGDNSDTVTLSVNTGPSTQMGGTLTETVLAGVATFSDLVLDKAGNYTLAENATGGISGPISGSFTVVPAAADHLVFGVQPSATVAGVAIKPAVLVRVLDKYGNLTSDSSDRVTLSVASGPGGFAHTSKLTATVSGGVATFSNLVLDTSGSYTLATVANLAGGGRLGPVASSRFPVASPVSLGFGSITYNKKTNLYGETVTLINKTSGPLTGPTSLELTKLPRGVVLTDATGKTNGNPYLHFLTSGKTLKKGASTSITLTFAAPSRRDVTFGTEVVVGR